MINSMTQNPYLTQEHRELSEKESQLAQIPYRNYPENPYKDWDDEEWQS
ncbi:MAG: hypothetical protein ACK5P5_02520 [Pseudobdellovibrionaceae bacterium]